MKGNSYTLQFFGLPNIQSIEDLAIETKLSKHMIYQLSKNADCHYKEYLIPKKSGKMSVNTDKKGKAFGAKKGKA